MIDQKGRSQQTTLHLLSTILVVLAFVGLLGLELWTSRKNALAQAQADLAIQADLLATHIGDRIARIDQVLAQVARWYPEWLNQKKAQHQSRTGPAAEANSRLAKPKHRQRARSNHL